MRVPGGPDPGLEQADALHDARALYEEGLALWRAGRADEALDRFGRAVDLQPGQALFQVGFGLALEALGQPEAALAAWRTALVLDPAEPHAWVNLANAGRAAGSAEAPKMAGDMPGNTAANTARARYLRALARDPGDPAALGNLGALEEAGGCPAAALPLYRRALVLDPAVATLWSNLGAARHWQGALAGAARDLDRAVALAPDLAEARWNRALNRLLRGDYAGGLVDHEWRWRRRGAVPPDLGPDAPPPWRGEPLAGRRLLVWTEQGYGDAIQFVRLIPRLTATPDGAGAVTRAGARAVTLAGASAVTLVCRPRLRRLLRSLDGVERIVGFGETAAGLPGGDPLRADLQVSLMSLPLLLGLTPETMTAAPYLAADPAAARRWKDFLDRREPARAPASPSSGAPLRVGLLWSGNPAHPNDRDRSLPAAALAPLCRLPGLRCLSLQADGAAGGVPGLEPLPPALDFADTAALVDQLDLVIAVDTAVAHLAGALGRPVWILLAAVPDWRWGMEGETTVWYPSARLFRQRRPGDWSETIDRVAAALAGLA